MERKVEMDIGMLGTLLTLRRKTRKSFGESGKENPNHKNMKFGFRVPSIKKRISARLSPKRYLRHSLGLKMPKGMGMISDPKRALYNKVYRKTTFGVENIFHNKKSCNYTLPTNQNPARNFGKVLLVVFGIIFFIINPILVLILGIILAVFYYYFSKTPKQQVKKSLMEARKSFNEENYEKTISILEEIIKNNQEEDNDIIYLLGSSYNNSGKYQEAIEPLKKSIANFPEDISSKIVLANCYYKTEKYQEAIAILQKISDDTEQYLKVIQLLGACFCAQKKYDLAIDTFKRAPLQKRNLDNDLMEVHYNLALIYEKSGDINNALKHFKKVFAQDINYKDVSEKIESLNSK